ncbi:hypothetical protein WJX77_012139 [Trebouxia sp. C0004]
MEQWLDLDADPLLDPTPPPPQHRGPALSRTSPEGAAFFKLQPCQDSINVPKQQALLAEGLLWLTKLTDPEYTAAEEARPNLAGTHGDSSSKSRGLQGRQQPPTVVHGLKVVNDNPAKLRLCINPMYVHLFMRYSHVQYERLSDLIDMLGPAHYMTTSDSKSGYWQLPLHRDMWQYAGFELDGSFYVWTVLPFGWAAACRIFTTYKQERSRARARPQSEGLIKVRLAIGTALVNTPDPTGKKALWLPAQQTSFLGFIADAAQQRFLPEDKKQGMLQLTSSIISSAHVTNKQLARVSDKMIAATPAVLLGPLFARAIYKAMIGKAAWDTVYP